MDTQRKEDIIKRLMDSPEYPQYVENIRRINDMMDSLSVSITVLSSPLLETIKQLSIIQAKFVNSDIFKKIGEIGESLKKILSYFEEVSKLEQQTKIQSGEIPLLIDTISDKGYDVNIVKKEIFRLDKIISKCKETLELFEELSHLYGSVNIDWEENIYDTAKNRELVLVCIEKTEKLRSEKQIQLQFLEDCEQEYQSNAKPRKERKKQSKVELPPIPENHQYRYDAELTKSVFDFLRKEEVVSVSFGEFNNCVLNANFAILIQAKMNPGDKSKIFLTIHYFKKYLGGNNFGKAAAKSVGVSQTNLTQQNYNMDDVFKEDLEKIFEKWWKNRAKINSTK